MTPDVMEWQADYVTNDQYTLNVNDLHLRLWCFQTLVEDMRCHRYYSHQYSCCTAAVEGAENLLGRQWVKMLLLISFGID
jgi:hypothetical protein